MSLAITRSLCGPARVCLLLCFSALFFLFGCGSTTSAPGPTPDPGGSSSGAFTGVLTQRNDNTRTGQNLNETTLTPANVNVSHFGKLFAMRVDGNVYAQPLYVPNVPIAGATHNVVYVATEADSVYAFDADGGALLWHASLIDAAHGATAGETTGDTVADIGPDCTDIIPQVGITSTPVIDPNSGTMFAVANSKKADGTYVYRLHRIDIKSGAAVSSPAVIGATLSGTGDGGASVTFDNLYELNRPGLLLLNGHVMLGFGSHCDAPPPAPRNFHGWLFSYDANTLTQAGVWLTTPNGSEGAIWMSGAGIAADSSGNIFAATGNGSFDATDWGDSVVKLALNGTTFSITDSFTPFDQANDIPHDYDVGAGGVVLLPDQAGNHPHELLAEAKNAKVYLIDRDQMTINNQHYCSGCTTDPIVQEFSIGTNGNPLYSTPAYWNGTVYLNTAYDPLMAFKIGGDGQFNTTASSSTPTAFDWPGTSASISANGVTNAIVWALDCSQFGPPVNQGGPAVLHAYDATNLGNELWNSSQAANSRDTAGNAVKFTVPTIANGKVYIGTQTEVDAYGLLTGTTAAVRKQPLPIEVRHRSAKRKALHGTRLRRA